MQRESGSGGVVRQVAVALQGVQRRKSRLRPGRAGQAEREIVVCRVLGKKLAHKMNAGQPWKGKKEGA
jgi:hypothetical protein